MYIPYRKFTVTGRLGICLLTFSAGKLEPQLPSPAVLYGLSVLGVMLILWEAVTYGAQLAQYIRSQSHQGHRHERRSDG
jgi:hypothetical protein